MDGGNECEIEKVGRQKNMDSNDNMRGGGECIEGEEGEVEKVKRKKNMYSIDKNNIGKQKKKFESRKKEVRKLESKKKK